MSILLEEIAKGVEFLEVAVEDGEMGVFDFILNSTIAGLKVAVSEGCDMLKAQCQVVLERIGRIRMAKSAARVKGWKETYYELKGFLVSHAEEEKEMANMGKLGAKMKDRCCDGGPHSKNVGHLWVNAQDDHIKAEKLVVKPFSVEEEESLFKESMLAEES